MMMLSAWSLDWGCCGLSPRPLTLTSLSGLLVAEAGADELVGVVMSMGSPGDGADIWIVGVMMGTVLAPIESSGPSAKWFLGALSVAVAICPMIEEQLSAHAILEGRKRKNRRGPARDGAAGACAHPVRPRQKLLAGVPHRSRKILNRLRSGGWRFGAPNVPWFVVVFVREGAVAINREPVRAAFPPTKPHAHLDAQLGSRFPNTSYSANSRRFEGLDTAVHAGLVWAAVVAVDWSRGEARGADPRNKWSGRCSFLSLAWWRKDSGLKRAGLPCPAHTG